MIATKHSGSASEHKAIAYLLLQGYDVFRNVSPHGEVDVIARDRDTGELLCFDVKTATPYRLKTEPEREHATAGSLSKKQIAQGVLRLVVVSDRELFFIDDGTQSKYVIEDGN